MTILLSKERSPEQFRRIRLICIGLLIQGLVIGALSVAVDHMERAAVCLAALYLILDYVVVIADSRFDIFGFWPIRVGFYCLPIMVLICFGILTSVLNSKGIDLGVVSKDNQQIMNTKPLQTNDN